MCLQIPGKVVSVEKNKAVIDYDLEKREAVIADVKCDVGDWVLVVGQFIVEKVPSDVGRESLNQWKKIRLD